MINIYIFSGLNNGLKGEQPIFQGDVFSCFQKMSGFGECPNFLDGKGPIP